MPRIDTQIARHSTSAFIGTPFALVRPNTAGAWPRWLSENSMREFENRNEFITDMNDTNSTIFIATAASVKPAMPNSDTYGDFRLALSVHGMHRIRIDTEPT